MHTIIITGASRGIGEATAKRFAGAGTRLILTCEKNREKLIELKEELDETGSAVEIYCGDAADPGFAERIFREDPTIDVLVNNAGISRFSLFQDQTWEEWNRVLSVNLSSAFSMIKAALPGMLRQKSGCIINISSVFGESGAACESAYSASKGGLNALTRSLAKELAPSGIRVNALSFGCIDTEMNERLTEEERHALEEEIPMGRFASPEEAAEAIFWLANAPSYLTGQVIDFSGGWMT